MMTLPWWQTTTIYQIYPRSYKDSNGDGIGDLRGIISKLDYIQDLGFETIWVSPFYASPQQDFGYDVNDYYNIAPEYGALADAEELIREVHKREMRILFDMVMNHTSIHHTWFQESRQSRKNEKSDWYLWEDGDGKRPPNNWKAIPGGSGWHYEKRRDQWYYTSFLPFQPDLNFRNPEVRKNMFDVVRFWLNKGVDGFRLDIFHAVYKDEYLRDNPFRFTLIPRDDMQGGFFQEWKYNLNQPETFELAKELGALAKSYSPPRMLIGEVFGLDVILKEYLGKENDGLDLIFLWDLVRLQVGIRFFQEIIDHHEAHYPAPFMPVYVYGNHDQKRILSKIGGNLRLAKILALLQFTVRGVPVVYYGEEIGMLEVDFPMSKAKDPIAQKYKWVPKLLRDLLDLYLNRDGCRTPMQWDKSANAGFCASGVKPWLPVHADYLATNVQSEQEDGNSLLNVYKSILNLRKKHVALRAGSLELTKGTRVGEVLAYCREYSGEKILVVINFEEKTCSFMNDSNCNQLLFEVGMEKPVQSKRIVLPPYSGVILGQ
jgi:oligo-1,6-glucosidase/alpha-glucosidase